jgi:hypothetical protein
MAVLVIPGPFGRELYCSMAKLPLPMLKTREITGKTVWFV